MGWARRARVGGGARPSIRPGRPRERARARAGAVVQLAKASPRRRRRVGGGPRIPERQTYCVIGSGGGAPPAPVARAGHALAALSGGPRGAAVAPPLCGASRSAARAGSRMHASLSDARVGTSLLAHRRRARHPPILSLAGGPARSRVNLALASPCTPRPRCGSSLPSHYNCISCDMVRVCVSAMASLWVFVLPVLPFLLAPVCPASV